MCSGPGLSLESLLWVLRSLWGLQAGTAGAVFATKAQKELKRKKTTKRLQKQTKKTQKGSQKSLFKVFSFVLRAFLSSFISSRRDICAYIPGCSSDSAYGGWCSGEDCAHLDKENCEERDLCSHFEIHLRYRKLPLYPNWHTLYSIGS